MNRLILILALTALPLFAARPAMSLPREIVPGRLRLSSSADVAPRSNAIGDIEFNAANGDIWISTGNGIAVSRDGGDSWETKLSGQGFSAISVLGNWVWAAASYDFEDPNDPNNSLPAGDAFYVSFDGGETFEHYREEEAEGLGKLAYDLAIIPIDGDTVVYAACFYGGLIRSEDAGTTWTNVFPDGSTELDYSDLAHRFFSIAADTSADPPNIWAGSARGFFMSAGGEDSIWTVFDTSSGWVVDTFVDTIFTDSIEIDTIEITYDSSRVISGNWTISIDFLYSDSTTTMFACTRPTSENNDGSDYTAISFTEDNGATWDRTGVGYVAWNMGFTGDTLWTACSHGLSRVFAPRYDDSDTVEIEGIDAITGLPLRILVDEVVSVTDCGGRLFVGTYSEGLAFSDDRGETWRILANFPDPNDAAADDPNADNPDEYVYAYPNPFSPRYHGGCFFVFNPVADGPVKIELFNYDIRSVATIFDGGDFIPGESYRVQWDGTLENGEYPDNGLYFFKITSGDDALWGKLMIIK